LPNKDTGLGTIGRIDQANITHKTIIKMHPHSNDEILSYFRKGTIIHSDSSGVKKEINANTLMLMRAGEVFYHEEEIVDYLEGLQIFIRPKYKNDTPTVTFGHLEQEFSNNTWRLLASPEDSSYVNFTSETYIFDAFLEENVVLENPMITSATTNLLYVFQGEVMVNNILLTKGESIVIKDEKVSIKTNSAAELVWFATNENSAYYANGMFSGNQY
jgi:quercetin 2,3-dioxygenase